MSHIVKIKSSTFFEKQISSRAEPACGKQVRYAHSCPYHPAIDTSLQSWRGGASVSACAEGHENPHRSEKRRTHASADCLPLYITQSTAVLFPRRRLIVLYELDFYAD